VSSLIVAFRAGTEPTFILDLAVSTGIDHLYNASEHVVGILHCYSAPKVSNNQHYKHDSKY
jgi:hypothetical protein